jgi:hypothetical protein
VISDQTPWRGLEEKGVGWDLPLDDMQGFVSCIERFASMDGEERRALSRAAAELAAGVAGSEEIVEANRRLFLEAVKKKVKR